MDKEPITLNGLNKLKEELIYLKEKKRPQIVAAIAEARSHGDLKENAEYHAAKEEQSHSEGRITEINDIIARANVIDVTKLNNDGKVIFGSTVYLEDLDTGEKINYKIVAKDEADLKQKLIFFQSPISMGLIGKNKKDNFEKDFKFVRDVGVTFQMLFNNIIRKKISKKWTLKEKEKQYIKRGRYAEFNLLYDRGTKFGLQTGGNVEGILMSLPPIAKWK